MRVLLVPLWIAMLLPAAAPAGIEEEIEAIEQTIRQIDAEIAHQQGVIAAMHEELAAAKRDGRKPDVSKLRQMATAAGQRTEAYHDKPAPVREAIDELESQHANNASEAAGLAGAWAAGNLEQSVYRTEIARSKRYIGILQRKRVPLAEALAAKRRLLPADIQAWIEEARAEDQGRPADAKAAGGSTNAVAGIQGRIESAAALIKQAGVAIEAATTSARARVDAARGRLIRAIEYAQQVEDIRSRMSPAITLLQRLVLKHRTGQLIPAGLQSGSAPPGAEVQREICARAEQVVGDPPPSLEQIGNWLKVSERRVAEAAERVDAGEGELREFLAARRRALSTMAGRLDAELARQEVVLALSHPASDGVARALDEANAAWFAAASDARGHVKRADDLLLAARSAVRALGEVSAAAERQRLLDQIRSWRQQARAYTQSLDSPPVPTLEPLASEFSIDPRWIDGARDLLLKQYAEAERVRAGAREVAQRLDALEQAHGVELAATKQSLIAASACLAELRAGQGRAAESGLAHVEALLKRAAGLLDDAAAVDGGELKAARAAHADARRRLNTARSALGSTSGRRETAVAAVNRATGQLQRQLRIGQSRRIDAEAAYNRLAAAGGELGPFAGEVCAVQTAPAARLGEFERRLQRLVNTIAAAGDAIEAFESSGWAGGATPLAGAAASLDEELQGARAVHGESEGLIARARAAGAALATARERIAGALARVEESRSSALALLDSARAELDAAAVNAASNRLRQRARALRQRARSLPAQAPPPEPAATAESRPLQRATSAQRALDDAIGRGEAARAQADTLVNSLEATRTAGEFATRGVPADLGRASNCLAAITPQETAVAGSETTAGAQAAGESESAGPGDALEAESVAEAAAEPAAVAADDWPPPAADEATDPGGAAGDGAAQPWVDPDLEPVQDAPASAPPRGGEHAAAARARVAACDYPGALNVTQRLARENPDHPWVALKLDELQLLARRQREAEADRRDAQAHLAAGRASQARESVQRARASAVECQARGLEPLVAEIERAVARRDAERQRERQQAAAEVMSALIGIGELFDAGRGTGFSSGPARPPPSGRGDGIPGNASRDTCSIQEYAGRADLTLLLEQSVRNASTRHRSYYIVSVNARDADGVSSHFRGELTGAGSTAREIMRSPRYGNVIARARRLCPNPFVPGGR